MSKKKSEMKQAFGDFMGKKPVEKEDEENHKLRSSENMKFINYENMNYDRRLTIPLSTEQERFLDDLVHKIHTSRNNKEQRITKASVIRSFINSFSLIVDQLETLEINNEKELNDRVIKLFRK